MYNPVVQLGKPESDIDNYNLHTSDGINIYLQNNAEPKSDTITIELKKMFLSEKYVVRGL